TSQAYSLQTPLGNSFSTVKMISSKDVWASGPDTLPGSSPQLAHWDGRHWNVVPIQLSGSAASLVSNSSTSFDFTALSTGDLWVSGSIYPPTATGHLKPYNLILHRDSTNRTVWRQIPIPDLSGGIGKMLAINADDIWIDGLDTMLHWNGQVWKKITRPDGNIYDMAAS